jgi:hypothetical protein
MVRFSKLFIAGCLLTLFSFYSPNTIEAKVWWDGVELKKGQIGRLVVLKDTVLYKLNGSQKSTARVLKSGEKYRIYTFLPGKLGLGGGYYIDRDNRVKYETPSKAKLQAHGVKIAEQTYEGKIKYPQIEILINRTAKNKINETIKKHIRTSYKYSLDLEQDEQDFRDEFYEDHGYPVPEDMEWMYNFTYDVHYRIKFNENNLLSILIYDSIYTGGAHGMSVVKSYNFNALTGDRIKLAQVATTSSAMQKMKNYVKVDLMNQDGRGQTDIFEEYIDSIVIDNDRPFYFKGNGIVVKFTEYEVGPYSSGMPESYIPYSVFK